MNKRKIVEKLLSDFLDLIYPRRCVFCGEFEKAGLCEKCQSEHEESLRNTLKPVPKHNHEADNIRNAYAPMWYNDDVKALVHKLKFDNELYLLEFCTSQMLSCLKNVDNLQNYDIIVCVPTKGFKSLKRDNISRLLAMRISKRLNVPFKYKSLKKLRTTQRQSHLLPQQRLMNVKGAYGAVENAFNKKRVLLIDDVYTTGATTNECAGAVMKDGAEYCDVLCFAASYKF